jgi:huntingtin interacting protein 1
MMLRLYFLLKGASSAKEFYAKNHKWTEGLVSAAKLIGVGANFLM